MSQTAIMQILKETGTPLSAEDLLIALKEKGETINEQSFYTNMEKIEKEKSIKFKEILIQRISAGRVHRFSKRVWFYRG